jgi:ATP/maltotriose-dependent transcriptional regulator MalT
LWPFWFLRDHLSEARTWTGQLLPSADSLDAPARAELLCTAAVIALEIGDDSTALAARQRLAAMQEEIGDPLVHAIAQLAIAWASPITGDFNSAMLAATIALEELHSQGEPLWTALAAGSLAWHEASAGRRDDALRHLQEVRDLGDELDSAWLAAWSRVQMGTLAITQGQLDQARRLLDDALALTIEAHSTNSVTLCLIAFARLAFSGGEPERAALLAGAAEGLRRRLGLRAWPMLRNDEADLIGQIRLTLGPDRFSEMTQVGYGLSRQEAVAAVSPQHGIDPADKRPVYSA